MPRPACRGRCTRRWRGRAAPARASRPVARSHHAAPASRATTTLDLPASVCESSVAARPSLLCAPSSTAPAAAVLQKITAVVHMQSLLPLRSEQQPIPLQFRFHSMRQSQQSGMCVGRGFICRDAHQRRPFRKIMLCAYATPASPSCTVCASLLCPFSRILRAPSASFIVYTSTVASNWP